MKDIPDTERGAIRRPKRSVARTVTYGLAIMVVVLVSLSVLGIVSFIMFKGAMDNLSSKSLPRMIQGAQFTSLSQQLVYETERLARVESCSERRIAYKGILKKLEKFEENLHTNRSYDQGTLQQDLIVLKNTLVELNDLAVKKIQVSQKMERAVTALFSFEKELMVFDIKVRQHLHDELSVQQFFLWVSQAMKIINHTCNFSDFNTLYKVRVAEKKVRREYFKLEIISEQFSEELQGNTGLMEAKLGAILLSDRGLLPLMDDHIKIMRSSAGRGNFTRSLVLEFESANTALFNTVISQISRQTVSLSNGVDTMIWIFFILILSAALIVVWVIYYFRKNLTARLLALNDAINNKLSGKDSEIDIRGEDEISEMARSFSYYAAEVYKREEELIKLATNDSLTGVSNRRCFLEKGERERARAERYGDPIAFLMMDLDYFKSINDTLGHHTGDVVLEKVANICRQELRDVDLFGRMGGEEFAALLPETDLEKGLLIAERLRLAIKQAVWAIDGQMVSCTVSIGVSHSREGEPLSLHTLMKEADRALYQAKENGRDQTVSASGEGGDQAQPLQTG